MAGHTPEGSQSDARQNDSKMNDLLSTGGEDFFTSHDEVSDTFNSMGLVENCWKSSPRRLPACACSSPYLASSVYFPELV